MIWCASGPLRFSIVRSSSVEYLTVTTTTGRVLCAVLPALSALSSSDSAGRPRAAAADVAVPAANVWLTLPLPAAAAPPCAANNMLSSRLAFGWRSGWPASTAVLSDDPDVADAGSREHRRFFSTASRSMTTRKGKQKAWLRN